MALALKVSQMTLLVARSLIIQLAVFMTRTSLAGRGTAAYRRRTAVRDTRPAGGCVHRDQRYARVNTRLTQPGCDSGSYCAGLELRLMAHGAANVWPAGVWRIW